MTNRLNGMEVILRTKETIYLRIPRALQLPTGTAPCQCPSCKEMMRIGSKDHSKWDTLAITTKPPKGNRNDTAWTVHFPDGALPEAIEHWKRKGELIEA